MIMDALLTFGNTNTTNPSYEMNFVYLGYIFLLPIMYMFLEKMNSMHQYHVRETCDAYLLCERVEDIETTIKKLEQQITIINRNIENLSN